MKLRNFHAVIAFSAITSHARPLVSQDLAWDRCADVKVNSTLPYECGILPVPLDYSDLSHPNISLQLLRVPATQQPARGSVLFNFGGPGAEARSTLASLGEVFMSATGGIYNLVAFDPRGVANTIPFNCSTTTSDLLNALKTPPSNASDVALAQSWAMSGVIAGQCLGVEQDIGSHIGTADVARDLISVVDVLEEDGMLRYWGISYGTTLGQTVAAMFPDRIDRIVIDAVQNVHEYYHALADFEEWTDSDKLFSAIWSTCLDAGSEFCPLAASWTSAAELEAAVWDLTFSIKHNPLAVGSNSSVLIDYAAMKSLFASSLYSPNTWPATAAIVDKLLKGEIDDELRDLFAASVPSTEVAQVSNAKTTFALAGIHCSDRFPRVQNLTDMQSTWDQLYNTSRVMGDLVVGLSAVCAQWKFDAADRYDGNFHEAIAINHPMMIIGNTLDGHTPLKSAYNASAIFNDSVVLQIDGYGHGSTNAYSTCAYQATAAYFVNGTLPQKGTICPIDVQPYHSAANAQVYKH